jgi:hypothetical protein
MEHFVLELMSGNAPTVVVVVVFAAFAQRQLAIVQNDVSWIKDELKILRDNLP